MADGAAAEGVGDMHESVGGLDYSRIGELAFFPVGQGVKVQEFLPCDSVMRYGNADGAPASGPLSFSDRGVVINQQVTAVPEGYRINTGIGIVRAGFLHRSPGPAVVS